jgi:signal transduction histidine kinase
VYWIVHRSGGHITVSDEDPRGSRVTVDLPRAER